MSPTLIEGGRLLAESQRQRTLAWLRARHARILTEQRETMASVRELAQLERRGAIQVALGHGLTKDDVAAELGISRRRVDQVLREE